MSMKGIPVASEIEAHRQTGVHVSAQPADVHGSSKHDVSVGNTGTYTSNGTQNRAIPHGLGVKPGRVTIQRTDGGALFSMISDTVFATASGTVTQSVAAKDSTNFYVGGAAGVNGNDPGYSWFWTAIP